MKNYLLTISIALLIASCEKETDPVAIENYLSEKVVNRIITNPSGAKVFFLSAVVDPNFEPWRCSIPFIYQLSCTDGEHTLYFENLHSVGDIAVDENCNLYACMLRNLVKFIPPKDSSSILQTNSIFSAVATDSAGKIWAGTYGGGLYYYDSHVWEHYTSANSGLTGNNISNVEIGKNNDVWISVSGDTGSLTCISDGIFKTFEWKKDLLGKNVDYISHLAVDKDGIAWVAYYDEGYKLITIDKNGNLNEIQEDFFVNKNIARLGTNYMGNIYLITYSENKSGLYFHNGFIWNEAILNVGDSYVNDIALDAEHNLWIGTSTGLIKSELQYLSSSD
jgi:hypothetical protein